MQARVMALPLGARQRVLALLDEAEKPERVRADESTDAEPGEPEAAVSPAAEMIERSPFPKPKKKPADKPPPAAASDLKAHITQGECNGRQSVHYGLGYDQKLHHNDTIHKPKHAKEFPCEN